MKKREIPWDKMRQEYIFTSATIRSLAAKYGCSKRAVDRRSVTEGWVALRRREMTSVGQESHARIHDAAVADRMRLYDATRAIADNMIALLQKAFRDPKTLYQHVVQRESTEYNPETKTRTTRRWAEGQALDIVNGKNAADMARALKDLQVVARLIDGIIDAPDRAKLDLERDKLDLEKRRSGMDDDQQQECGIAIMPAIDNSLLDKALPDPDQSVTL